MERLTVNRQPIVKMNLVIREFEDNDHSAVIKIWESLFKNDPPWNNPASIIKRKQAFQSDLFLVGEKNRKVVATVLGGYDGFRGWVYHLAVEPDKRRAGIARRMMDAIEKKLKNLGCIKINLQIRASNLDVVAFYEAIGYSKENHISMGKLIK
jgi:ribosomal protein S18 acetylase RimI-like enzyme